MAPLRNTYEKSAAKAKDLHRPDPTMAPVAWCRGYSLLALSARARADTK